MKPSAPVPEPKFRRLLLLGIAAIGIPAALGVYHLQRDRLDNAARVQSILDQGVSGAGCLRIWGAGMRTSSGFCPCAMVPKPERVFYETKDPGEIREFGSLLHARPFLKPEPQCKCCGEITIDFLRGDEILLSIHPHGESLRSTRGTLPVTPETFQHLEEWLARRSIREKILQAMRGPSPK